MENMNILWNKKDNFMKHTEFCGERNWVSVARLKKFSTCTCIHKILSLGGSSICILYTGQPVAEFVFLNYATNCKDNIATVTDKCTNEYEALVKWYWWENQSTQKKTCPCATWSTTNHTRSGLDSNPYFHGERPATNCLNHGTNIMFCIPKFYLHN